MKEFHDLLKTFIDNAQKSSNTQIFLETTGITDRNKFMLEAIILYFGKAIFMKYCIDNDFLSVPLKNDLYESMNEFYEHFEDRYFNLANDEVYTYYIPPRHLELQLLDLLNKYDFRDVDTDLIGKLYEQFISKEERILLGQVYTPDEIIDYILTRVGYTISADLKNKKIIDISCGSGAFILRAANILIKNLKRKKYSYSSIFEILQNNIWGLDINPFSLKLSELNLLLATFDILEEIKKTNPTFKTKGFNLFLTNSVNKRDSSDNETVFCLKNKMREFKGGFDFVIGNPPYLEAKKMPGELKKVCRENFPEVAKGAFDLYFCFIKMALDLLNATGMFGYIIPNKVQVLKSARWLRKCILDNFSIEEIVDISNLEIFKNISVYPILLFIKNQKKKDNRIRTYDSIDRLEKVKLGDYQPTEIKQNDFINTEDFIFYTLPQENIGLKIYEKMSSKHHFLKEYLDIRWGISFHKKGIINDFVFRKPVSLNPRPILGADISSRHSEVFQYQIRWNGFWIDYNEEKAKKINNPFPPRRIFETPKLIIRQNAEKLTVAVDSAGKWYLKDVLFSGRLTERAKKESISLEFLAAVLNSRLLNYYYSILFKGGHVNNGYLHFLVSYLNTLPIVLMTTKEQLEIVKRVNILLEKYDEDIKSIIDGKICEIYELSDTETNFILRR
ncbi:N-6 DNA methylase [candidate division WOR-3 bacterium]|nr:N-6 DNA methylase [candidate division WOR-3 bacterium]